MLCSKQLLMHCSPAQLWRRGADFPARVHGDASKHKPSLPPQVMRTTSRTTFWMQFFIQAGRREGGEKASCGKKKRVNNIQSTASRQRKTFFPLTFSIPTLPLLLKCWCWLGTPAAANYTGSVTSLSPLLENHYRAAYRERRRSVKRKTRISGGRSFTQQYYPKGFELLAVIYKPIINAFF